MGKRDEDAPVKANTAVLRCGGPTCISEFQDQRYGAGMRVHNRTKQSKQAAEQRWRCTVCKGEKPV